MDNTHVGEGLVPSRAAIMHASRRAGTSPAPTPASQGLRGPSIRRDRVHVSSREETEVGARRGLPARWGGRSCVLARGLEPPPGRAAGPPRNPSGGPQVSRGTSNSSPVARSVSRSVDVGPLGEEPLLQAVRVADGRRAPGVAHGLGGETGQQACCRPCLPAAGARRTVR